MIRLKAAVRKISALDDHRWKLEIVDGSGAGGGGADGAAGVEEKTFDAVVLATPWYREAQLLTDVDRELAELVGTVTHAGEAVVVAGYRRDQIRHSLDGFGFVVPAIEGRRLGRPFTSVKFDGRAPHDQLLTRTFIGGACQPELMQNGDDALKQYRPRRTRRAAWHSRPAAVRRSRAMGRHDAAVPCGHLDLVAQIKAQAARWKNFALAGNAPEASAFRSASTAASRQPSDCSESSLRPKSKFRGGPWFFHIANR